MIMSHKVPPTDTWILSSDNHPLAPASFQSAPELINKSEAELRQILSRVGSRKLNVNGYQPV